MKTILFTLTFSLHLICHAQYTTIPDTNFEQTLIAQGFDNTFDGQVLTATINSITELDICCVGISDLTGINDFTALVSLEIDSNNLTSFDISGLSNLIMLDCEDNILTQIDVSANTNLMYLTCNMNQLTEISLNQNLQLEQLWCDDNQLTTLDLSANTHLNELYCGDNPLSFLNIQNGNNSNMLEFNAINTASNLCIQVDDAALATTASTAPYNAWEVDATAEFSNDCGVVSVNDIKLQKISISPSIVKDVLQVNNIEIENLSKILIYDVIGKEVFVSNELIIDVTSLKSGVYVVKIINKNGHYALRKVVKQ